MSKFHFFDLVLIFFVKGSYWTLIIFFQRDATTSKTEEDDYSDEDEYSEEYSYDEEEYSEEDDDYDEVKNILTPRIRYSYSLPPPMSQTINRQYALFTG